MRCSSAVSHYLPVVGGDREVRVEVRPRRVVVERVVADREVEREEVVHEDVDAEAEVEAEAGAVVERRVPVLHVGSLIHP